MAAVQAANATKASADAANVMFGRRVRRNVGLDGGVMEETFRSASRRFRSDGDVGIIARIRRFDNMEVRRDEENETVVR
jgi:hypothetical protein